jgi:hypothetical protein
MISTKKPIDPISIDKKATNIPIPANRITSIKSQVDVERVTSSLFNERKIVDEVRKLQ